MSWLERPIQGLLLDISGVLKDGDVAIPGSVEAIKKLKSLDFPFRLVTNETLKSRKTVTGVLNKLGFDITEDIMIHPVPALIETLKEKNLRPKLLIHPQLLPEFEGIEMEDPNCVVVADAEEYFTYHALNDCFRVLMQLKDPILYSLGMGKYYLDDDGLSLDVGPFVKGLEYATGVKPIVIGKPQPKYFMLGVDSLKFKPESVLMVGDDIEGDVGGAQAVGMRAVLVRTGKYRPSDEVHATVKPTAIVNNLLELVCMIESKLDFWKQKYWTLHR